MRIDTLRNSLSSRSRAPPDSAPATVGFRHSKTSSYRADATVVALYHRFAAEWALFQLSQRIYCQCVSHEQVMWQVGWFLAYLLHG